MKLRTPGRSELRLADLKARRHIGHRSMNVKIPAHLQDAITNLAGRLKPSRTEVIVALLNEGLNVVGRLKKRS